MWTRPVDSAHLYLNTTSPTLKGAANMAMTSGEIKSAIDQLAARKPKTKPQQTKDALADVQLSDALREHRSVLRHRVNSARAALVRLQKKVAEIVTSRGRAKGSAEFWSRRTGGPAVPFWCDERKLKAAHDSLANATAQLAARMTEVELFDQLHGLAALDYTEVPEPLDVALIEEQARAAGLAETAAVNARFERTGRF
jgi:hypothetical protein